MFTFRKLCLLAITWILLISGLNPTTTTLAQSTHEEGDRQRTGLQATAMAASLMLPAADTPQALLDISPQAQPNAVTSWQKVVYSSYTDTDFEIYLSDPFVGNRVRLTTIPKSDIQPRLNRGGTLIAFASNRNSDYEIYTMLPNGASRTALTENVKDDVTPAWSPDGKKIAFTSYRDGHGEVYVMNANGTGQTRLTMDSAGYNGEPAWSPDGTKITFTSYRNQVWRIWVMNADGSGQTQLSQQAYSENPVWSPDGTKIAYDCDGDGNGWQETWWMDARGGANARMISPSRDMQDIFMNSWAPDQKYIALNEVSYILYNGQYYWIRAEIHGLLLILIGGAGSDQPMVTLNDTDRWGDWQTLDTAAPVSAVKALPYQSPDPFTVEWGSTDPGGSGVASYTVQVRVGAGAWMDWMVNTTETSASYLGIAGETYAFRSRAVDNAFNLELYPANADAVTTVETLPPICHVAPTPPVWRANIDWMRGVVLTWSAVDPGGSGIQGYEVQSWDGNQLDNIYNGGGGYTTFMGSGGKTYQFRCRALDTAGNQEEWQAGFDTSTAFYDTIITGSVYDSMGISMDGGVEIQSNPPAVYLSPNEGNGGYHAYVTNLGDTPYTLTWSAPDRLALPGSRLPGSSDQTHDTFLPPADNVIADWGFESGNPAANGWQVSGDTGVVQDLPLTYSGQFALQLGHPEGFTPPALVINSPTNNNIMPSPKLLAAPDGALHLLWITYDDATGVLHDQLNYSWRPHDSENWSDPVVIDQATYHYIGYYDFRLDSSGNLHVIWLGYNSSSAQNVLYRMRSSTGVWSDITTIAYAGQQAYDVQLNPDSSGALHVLWRQNNNQFWYAHRTPEGVWDPAQSIFTGSLAQMKVDGLNRVHFAWRASDGVRYQRREASGSWSPVTYLGGEKPQMVVQADGTVHLVYQNNLYDGPFLYVSITPDGTWSSSSVIVPSPDTTWSSFLIQAADMTLYFFWRSDSDLKSLQKKAGGSWTQLPTLSNIGGYNTREIFTDSLSQVHVVYPNETEMKHTYINSQGIWSPLETVNSEKCSDLAIDGADGLHVVEYRDDGIYYSHNRIAGQASIQNLSQTVTLPENASQPVLSFMIRDGYLFDNGAFSIQATQGQTTTTLYSNVDGNYHWAHHWLDLSAYAGQTFTLTFQLTQDANQHYAAVYLDEITLGSVSPDLWVHMDQDPATVVPGKPVTWTVTYGNRGGSPSPAATLVLTLPGEVIVDSVSIPPAQVNGSSLSWDINELPANSGPFTIVVVTHVDPDAANFTKRTPDVEIQTNTVELTKVNNTAETVLSIGGYLHLPILRR